MAVYKRKLCLGCKSSWRAAKEPKGKLPPCPKCGGKVSVSENWYVSVSVVNLEGARVPITRSVGSKEEAVTLEAELLAGKGNGERVNTNDTSMKTLFKNFLDWVDTQVGKQTLSSGTAKMYKSRVNNHLSAFFGEMDAQDITKATVDRFVDWRLEMDPRPANASINHDVGTLVKCLSVAVEARVLRIHPLHRYTMLAKNNERDRWLSREECKKLLDACPPVDQHPLRTIVTIALNTGLRREGVLGLKWEHVDFNQGRITRFVKGRAAKGRVKVVIPMTASCRAALEFWKAVDGAGHDHVFINPDTGNPYHVNSNIGFGGACKRAGIEDFTFHDLRHTFCTHFLYGQPDKIEVLARIVGHSGAGMTRRYAHIIDKAKHDAMDNFEIQDI